jgi:predicted aspartyl protease
MARRLLLLTLALAASAAFAQTKTTQLQTVGSPGPVDKRTQTEDVHFRADVYQRMTVPVRVSGTGPYRFLVDTGADRTAISRELATHLKLEPGENAELHSIARESTVQTAMVPSLQLTRKEVRVRDAPLLSSENIGADGILGVDSLRSQRIMFDFDKQTMSIVPSATPDFRDEPGTIVVEANGRNGRLIVTEATANGHSVVVIIDTGSQISLGNRALHRALMGNHMLKGSEEIVLESVTGDRLTGDYMVVRDLEMGPVGLKDLAIVFADAHVFKQLKLENKPALLLGMNAMRAFKKVSIDFAAKRLRLVVPEHSELDVQTAERRRALRLKNGLTTGQ